MASSVIAASSGIVMPSSSAPFVMMSLEQPGGEFFVLELLHHRLGVHALEARGPHQRRRPDEAGKLVRRKKYLLHIPLRLHVAAYAPTVAHHSVNYRLVNVQFPEQRVRLFAVLLGPLFKIYVVQDADCLPVVLIARVVLRRQGTSLPCPTVSACWTWNDSLLYLLVSSSACSGVGI